MKTLLKQTLAAALLAGPAAAQDISFGMSGTLSCLDRADWVYAEMEACIGTSAGACMEATPMGGSTIGMSECLDRELDYWDERLNAGYRVLRDKERRDDAEWSGSPGVVSKADALRDMQRAWIAFRDATCDYERSQWGGGTGGGPATVGCLMRLTGEQAIYLESMMAEG
ncbi:MAG: DUF1311 domain-containing protein [Rhodobacteraceae bacterium]|nr:DUF1311 domain-containing protein [Paracoccaceae bacterium]